MDKQISWPGWENVRLLGAGSFGKVYEIQRQESGETYKAALKIITIPQNRADVVSAYNDGMDDKSVTAYFHSYVEEITKEFGKRQFHDRLSVLSSM